LKYASALEQSLKTRWIDEGLDAQPAEVVGRGVKPKHSAINLGDESAKVIMLNGAFVVVDFTALRDDVADDSGCVMHE
jgi:hypothetical protein